MVNRIRIIWGERYIDNNIEYNHYDIILNDVYNQMFTDNNNNNNNNNDNNDKNRNINYNNQNNNNTNNNDQNNNINTNNQK